MKKILFTFLVAFSAIVVNAQKEIINDPAAEVRIVNGSFNNIKISGGIDLFLSQGNSEAIAISASEEKYKDDIKTVIENNTLKIYYFGSKGWGYSKKYLRVYVSFKNLESIEATSACDVQVAGVVEVPTLKLSMTGASDFKGAVKVDNLKIMLSGASDATIKGYATNVQIQSSGASDVKGTDLITDYCNASASGASDINITVNKEITASASGASDINYKGEAVIKKSSTNGASSVNKKS